MLSGKIKVHRIAFHVVRVLGPSVLNRDASGLVKETMFGGYRRVRQSSQNRKRPVRLAFNEAMASIGRSGDQINNSRAYARELFDRLISAGKTEAEAKVVSEAAIEGLFGGKPHDDLELHSKTILNKTLGEVEAVSSGLVRNWDKLSELAATAAKAATSRPATKKGKKEASSEGGTEGGEKADPKEKSPLAKEIKKLSIAGKWLHDNESQTLGLALATFGRFVADRTDLTIESAMHVSHVIGTNARVPESDYFSTVDDLRKTSDGSGSAMNDYQSYSSDCVYEYWSLDVRSLADRSGASTEEVLTAVEKLAYAIATRLPTAKQTSFACQTPPAYMLVSLNDEVGCTLHLAFEDPVTPEPGQAQSYVSARRMLETRAAIAKAFAGQPYLGETAILWAIERHEGLPLDGIELTHSFNGMMALIRSRMLGENK